MFTLKKDDVIIITTNNEKITRPIEYITSNHFKYVESPKINCEVKVNGDEIIVIKSGEINFTVKHKQNYREQVDIIINQNGQKFNHQVTITTNEVNINKEEIYINFENDEQVVTMNYQIKRS